MGMNRFAIVSGIVGVSAAAALGLSGVATAAPSGPGSASDVVQSLKDQGYNVMLNGTTRGPLSDCTVTGIHNPDTTGRAAALTTVYVDVDCPGADN
jgi:hypothetical protein